MSSSQVLPSPSDPYNPTVFHFASAMKVGEKPTSGTVSKLDPVPAPPALRKPPEGLLISAGCYGCSFNGRTGLLSLSHPKTVKMRKPRVLAARTLDFLIEGSVISP